MADFSKRPFVHRMTGNSADGSVQGADNCQICFDRWHDQPDTPWCIKGGPAIDTIDTLTRELERKTEAEEANGEEDYENASPAVQKAIRHFWRKRIDTLTLERDRLHERFTLVAEDLRSALDSAINNRERADAAEARCDKVKAILAGTDTGSLPADMTLEQIAQQRMADHAHAWDRVERGDARCRELEAEVERLKRTSGEG